MRKDLILFVLMAILAIISLYVPKELSYAYFLLFSFIIIAYMVIIVYIAFKKPFSPFNIWINYDFFTKKSTVKKNVDCVIKVFSSKAVNNSNAANQTGWFKEYVEKNSLMVIKDTTPTIGKRVQFNIIDETFDQEFTIKGVIVYIND